MTTLRNKYFIRGLILILSVPCSRGQTSLVSGALDGSVSDSSGGRIAGAKVIVREIGTGKGREASANGEGAYRIGELSPGLYEISVSHPGFAPYKHTGVTLPLGSTVHLDIVLASEGVTTQVTVTAQPPAIDPAQTSVSSAVDTERIEELPVESRNYLNFALLAPGVASSAQQAGQQSLGPLPDSGFTFGGLRGRSNNITIDGLDNNDEFVGSSRTELSLETVQEFQVVNAGLSAETGGASGGSINVVTRIGANTIHGDAFLFLQNGSLNARNPFEAERATPMLHKYRAGLAMGGPIVKNRTFYYAAFEQEHKRSLEDSYINQAVEGAINRVLAGGAFPRLSVRRVTDNFFPTARVETEASGKVNHQLARNSVMLRYAFTNNREAGDAFHTAGWTDPSGRGSSFTQDHAVVGALTTTFDPQSVGDLRFQIADRRAVLRTNDSVGPGINVAGLVEFGRPYDGNGRRSERHDQVTYTYSHNIGHHLWKAGTTVNHVREDAAMADGFGATYIFANLADFAAGRPNQFRQAFGAAGTNYSVTNFGVFVTDHWSATGKLVLDLGLRYDFEKLPGAFRQDANNFSPRVGLAYHLAPAWVLRAGYGIFFDRYVLASLNPALQKNGTGAFEQVLSGDAAAAAFQTAAGGGWTAPIAGVRPSIYRADPGLAAPYSQQVNFALEHLLARDLTANASYLFVRGVKLSRTRNINLVAPGHPVFGPDGLDPRFTDIYQLEDSASSTYQGVSFTLNKRMSNELALSGSYTLAKTFDDASDFNEQPMNPFDLVSERAVSLQHQQQRFVFNALWDLPIGEEEAGKPAKDNWVNRVFGHIQVAPILVMESGRPVNPLTGVDSNGSHPFPLSARPLGFGRNSLRTPKLANIDFRIVKYFPVGKTSRVDLVAEAFNLFNRANVSQINPIFGIGSTPQPGFLQPITGVGARRLQFSLDFEF